MGQGQSLTLDELRVLWSDFAPHFEQRFEPITRTLARTLHDHVGLDGRTDVLEVGGGAGGGALDLLAREDAQQCTLTITDLSGQMVRLARDKHGNDVGVLEADAQALPFGDAEFDCVVANLNLMIVPEASRAIAEAARVLRPGGRAAWSVWGRPSHSPMMTLAMEAAEALGVSLPAPPRSNFHLGDKERLCRMVIDGGFAKVRAWYQPMVADVSSGEAFASLSMDGLPRTEQLLASLPASVQPHFRSKVVELANQTLRRGNPIALDVLVVVAER